MRMPADDLDEYSSSHERSSPGSHRMRCCAFAIMRQMKNTSGAEAGFCSCSLRIHEPIA